MYKYKITIEYDGSKYKGWQRLKETDKTIQDKIEVLLQKITGEPIEIHGAGRTDAGVHASHQVAHFETKQSLDLDHFLFICNEMLPQDIVFKKVELVPPDFHARFSAKSKHYLYKIWNNPIRSAIHNKYAYHVAEPLDLEAMREAASYFIGEHNFQSFTANKSKKKSMVRTIFSLEITKNDEWIELHFYGDGFLYKMVRIMTGTLIEVGLGKRKPIEIKSILEKQDRILAGDTAPSHGLYLADIEY